MDNRAVYKFGPNFLIHISIGFFLIFLFFIIYFFISIYIGSVNFFSLFFHNIDNNIIKLIFSILLISILAAGILILMITFFYIKYQIIVYEDKFLLKIPFKQNIIIKFSEITSVYVNIYFKKNENIVNNYKEKECRVYFNNPEQLFYLSYPVTGYFDDVKIDKYKIDLLMENNYMTTKNKIAMLIGRVRKFNNIKVPSLPHQSH